MKEVNEGKRNRQIHQTCSDAPSSRRRLSFPCSPPRSGEDKYDWTKDEKHYEGARMQRSAVSDEIPAKHKNGCAEANNTQEARRTSPTAVLVFACLLAGGWLRVQGASDPSASFGGQFGSNPIFKYCPVGWHPTRDPPQASIWLPRWTRELAISQQATKEWI